MTLQDDLLSFQIRETIFLSSNKASIAELKELELLPDVEIMETPTEISITGCLYLQGKYTPVEETREKREGGTDTLVSALQFTPFPHEENQTSEFLYEPEAELSHRIPLNVSIPVDRVKEMGDVYAIVDGFDYQLVSANQLQIQADLKIAGISLQTEASDDTEYENEPEQDQVEWEFVHVAEDQEENNDFQPVSLDDIERKLAALEQEIETHQYKAPESHPYYNRKESSAYGYPKRAEQTESIAFAEESYGRQSSFGDITYAREAYDSQADYCDEEQDNKSDQEQHEAEQWETGYESPQISYTSEKRTRTEAEEVLASLVASDSSSEAEAVEAVGADAEVEETQLGAIAAHDADEETELETVVADAEAEETEPAAEPASADTQAEAVADVQVQEANAVATEEEKNAELQGEDASIEAVANLEANEPTAESKEMKVAISGKPAKEPEGAVNLTSIFSQAKRAQEKSVAAEPESSAASPAPRNKGAEANSSTLEAVGNLTSFVRSKDEHFSKMKLCIIQKHETIESIASRYSLPVSRILEVNNLSADRIAEGQILYIPQ